jgi:hypothetical protein
MDKRNEGPEQIIPIGRQQIILKTKAKIDIIRYPKEIIN